MGRLNYIQNFCSSKVKINEKATTEWKTLKMLKTHISIKERISKNIIKNSYVLEKDNPTGKDKIKQLLLKKRLSK